MKLIPLTQGYFAEVSDEDYDFINQWKWTVKNQRGRLYAVRQEFTGNRYSDGSKKYKLISMHRVLFNLFDKNILIDHKDRNGLNNKRDNIRMATNKENCRNSKSREGSTSKYLGVCINKSNYVNKSAGKECAYLSYIAYIKIDGHQKYLGSFSYSKEGELMAAKAYDIAAKKYFGEFANLNFKE